jgi:hypothetical protein
VIEGGRDAEAPVDARVEVMRDLRHAVGLQEGQELVAPDIEEEMAEPSAFSDLQAVGGDQPGGFGSSR